MAVQFKCSKLMTVSWYRLAHMYVVVVNITILFMIGQSAADLKPPYCPEI